MIIHEVGQDYDNFRFLVFKEDGVSSKRTLEFKGQSLIQGWEPLQLQTFVDPRKKKDKRRLDYDASCYFSARLIVNNRTEQILDTALNGNVEFLPVIVDDKTNEFKFVNVLNVIEAVKTQGLSKVEQMDLFRDKKMQFNLDLIKGKYIFRDSVFGGYYCTALFIELIENNDIKGLRFEKVGEAL